jgi:hypothetical protein
MLELIIKASYVLLAFVTKTLFVAANAVFDWPFFTCIDVTF